MVYAGLDFRQTNPKEVNVDSIITSAQQVPQLCQCLPIRVLAGPPSQWLQLLNSFEHSDGEWVIARTLASVRRGRP